MCDFEILRRRDGAVVVNEEGETVFDFGPGADQWPHEIVREVLAMGCQMYALGVAVGEAVSRGRAKRGMVTGCERTATVVALRALCARCGDNDWTSNERLDEIVSGHVAPHVRDPKGE